MPVNPPGAPRRYSPRHKVTDAMTHGTYPGDPLPGPRNGGNVILIDRCTKERPCARDGYEYWTDEGGEHKGARITVNDLPQPRTRGKVSTVDHGANTGEVKIILWVPREDGAYCDIAVDDEVEIKTISRVMRHTWRP
jgi:hypothetical protein